MELIRANFMGSIKPKFNSKVMQIQSHQIPDHQRGSIAEFVASKVIISL